MFDAKHTFSGDTQIRILRRLLVATVGTGLRGCQDLKEDRASAMSGRPDIVGRFDGWRRTNASLLGTGVMLALLLIAVPVALAGGAVALFSGATLLTAFLTYVAIGSGTLLAGACFVAFRPPRRRKADAAALGIPPAQNLQDRLFEEITTRFAAEHDRCKTTLILGARIMETRKLQSLLQELNYNVITCHDPYIAIEMIIYRPDCFEHVLVDAVHLGEDAAQEFYRELRIRESDLPVIILRGSPPATTPKTGGGRNMSSIKLPRRGKTAAKMAILTALEEFPESRSADSTDRKSDPLGPFTRLGKASGVWPN